MMRKAPSELLTADEHRAVELLGQAANLMSRIIGQGEPRAADVAEMVGRIHDLQHMVMAQAAARAYPNAYRLLGELGSWS